MKLGGAPTGKRASTEFKERDIREHADPSLKEKRLQEERAKRRCFFKPSLTASEPGTSVPGPTDMHMDEYTPTPGTDTALAPSEPAHVEIIPELPRVPASIKDRQSGILYSYLHAGRVIVVRWQQKSKFLVCSCDLSVIPESVSAACKGNCRLDRCLSLLPSAGAPADCLLGIGGRPKVQRDYVAMSGSSSGAKRPGGAEHLYTVEIQRLAQVCEIPRGINHAPALHVLDKGRWDKDLLKFEAWTFESKTCESTTP